MLRLTCQVNFDVSHGECDIRRLSQGEKVEKVSVWGMMVAFVMLN